MSSPRREDRKCYGQVCTVARALDVIGDRWTLLILRELLGGATRFNELQAGLPGIAKNLLTERLRRLESDGLVRRVSSGGSTQYSLSELGTATRPIVEALGLWGAKAPKLAPPEHDRSLRSIAVALQTMLGRAKEALPASPIVVELELDEQVLEIVVGPAPTVNAGPSPNPDTRLRTTHAAISNYLQGRGLDRRKFVLNTGEKAGREALLRAMAAML